MSVAWVGVGVAALGAGAAAINANKAKNAQQGAANAANQLTQDQYSQTRTDQQPYRDAGYAALQRMNDLLGLSKNTGAEGYGSLAKTFTGDSVNTDPGYQFGLTQGLNSVQNSAAARGGLYSGATLKALTQYGNDYATTKFDDAFNRDQQTKTSIYNKLAGVSGTGQTASNTVDSQGAGVAVNNGNNLIGAGNARGASDIATGNAIVGGLNQAGAWWLRSGNQPGASSYGGGGLTSQAGSGSTYLPATDAAWSTYQGG